MLSFLFYLLKISICSAVLFAYYWFFLRNKVFHAYNRFYLLGIAGLSPLLPLVKINFWERAATAKPAVIKLLQVVDSSDEYLDEIIVNSRSHHFSAAQAGAILYIGISTILVLLFVRTVVNIYRIYKTNSHIDYKNIRLVDTNDKRAPFSFLHFIFWNPQIELGSKGGQRIFKHELVHVQEKHSYDKIFFNLLLVVFWLNPVFWIIRRELNMIHEFIADKKAVEDGDLAAFSAMILQATYPQHRFSAANHFFYSPIKRRIAMLSKMNNPKAGYISRLLVLPLMFILFAAFALKTKKTILAGAEKITVVIDAGHGGEKDPGATAADGTREKDIALAIAKRVKELNNNSNIELILTRETDIYQSPKEKADLVNKYGADLLVSIHMSTGPAGTENTKSGVFTYISRSEYANSDASKYLASSIIQKFQADFPLPVESYPQKRSQGIWLLQASKCPAVIIETGFMNNDKDLRYIKSSEGQQKIAKNILDAIAGYAATIPGLNEQFLQAALNDTTRKFVYRHKRDAGNFPKQQLTDQFNGKTIDSITLTKDDAALVHFSDGSRLPMDQGKAMQAKILPYPPPPPPPAFATENFSGKLSDLKMEFNEPLREEPLIIINGKEYPSKDLKFKTITAKTAWFYQKGDKLAIEKFGSRAADGAMIFEEAVIEDMISPENEIVVMGYKKKNNTYTTISADSVYMIDASQRKTDHVLTNMQAETKSPLYILNGKEISKKEMDGIDPGQIDRMNVLKDKNAKDKYGERGKNGVIEIITKTGLPTQKQWEKASGDQKPDKVFVKLEMEPEFPGGKNAWAVFLQKNLNAAMPVEEGWKAGVYKVIIRFIVRSTGEVTDVQAENYAGTKTANMCIELIKNGPKWVPGKQNGKLVNAYKKQPITFIITEQ
ncbi:MAG: N-acetylmuramoyl-L-alanine amidase [Ferruginibacter sp.]